MHVDTGLDNVLSSMLLEKSRCISHILILIDTSSMESIWWCVDAIYLIHYHYLQR